MSDDETQHDETDSESPESPTTGGFFDDLKRWEISQDYLDDVGVVKQLAAKVGKPSKQQFFRVHPKYFLDTLIIEEEETRETYLVEPKVVEVVGGEFPGVVRRVRLVLVMTKLGNLLVWPLKVGPNHWNMSAVAAAEEAKRKWIRMEPNMSAGYYDICIAIADHPEPPWPEQSWAEILDVAFRGKVIDALNHPVLAQLRGEI